jgi:3-dehydroquinate synthetase
MLPLMRQDKKNASGIVRCVLLQDLGAAMIDVEVSDNEIRDAMLRLGQ